MATTKTISAALNLIYSKKANLRKAYDELQAHCSLLSSSSSSCLSWSDFDSHFTSIQDSLTQRFHHLEYLESRQCDPQLEESSQSIPAPPFSSSSLPNQNTKFEEYSFVPDDPSPSSNHPQNGTDLAAGKSAVRDAVMPRRALVALCEKMDGKGLRRYFIERFRRNSCLEDELPGALRPAPDPAAMVLDSLDGLHGANGIKDAELRRIRSFCLLFLGKLRAISPKIEFNAREEARKLGGGVETEGHD